MDISFKTSANNNRTEGYDLELDVTKSLPDIIKENPSVENLRYYSYKIEVIVPPRNLERTISSCEQPLRLMPNPNNTDPVTVNNKTGLTSIITPSKGFNAYKNDLPGHNRENVKKIIENMHFSPISGKSRIEKDTVCLAMANSKFNHFLILVRSKEYQQYVGLYTFDTTNNIIIRLHGYGPAIFSTDFLLEDYFKYDPTKNCYESVTIQGFKNSVDAFSISNNYWSTKYKKLAKSH